MEEKDIIKSKKANPIILPLIIAAIGVSLSAIILRRDLSRVFSTKVTYLFPSNKSKAPTEISYNLGWCFL